MRYNLHVLNSKKKNDITTPKEEEQDSIRSAVLEAYETCTGSKGDDNTSIADMEDNTFDELISKISENLSKKITVPEKRPATLGALVEMIDHMEDGSIKDFTGWDESVFWKTRRKLDITHQMLMDYGYSNEGVIANVGSTVAVGMLKIFVGTVDAFVGVGNALKTNLFKFYKPLKRSELRYFYEVNMSKVAIIENKRYTDLMNIQAPIPTGMQCSYAEAVQYLNQVYTTLNMVAYVDMFISTLKDMRIKITRGKEYTAEFNKLVKSANASSAELKNVIAKQYKLFNDKDHRIAAKYSSVFKSVGDMAQVRKDLLNMEPCLTAAASFPAKIDKIDAILADITDYLSEDKEVDPRFVKDFTEVIRYMAVAFDVYGQNVVRQLALEHNLVLIYNTIYKV